jgi:sulfoxide reductase heme-binding subunit YedZ
MGTRLDLRRLVRHYLVLALASGAMMLAVSFTVPSQDFLFRSSMATAYAGLALLGATLITGPWNVLRLRRNPVSSDLRRDMGICGAVLSLAHVVIGLQVHSRGAMIHYFLRPPDEGHASWGLRFDRFGLANYTGLGAALLIVLLAALSNDWSLRSLGGRRWKALQRNNYALFALVVIHGVAYQVLETRETPYPALFAAMVAVVLAIQWAGYRRRSGL